VELQENVIHCVGLEVLITVAIESAISWIIKLCGKTTEVLEEYLTSIFRVEEEAKEETSMQQAGQTARRK
jgi:hypothetical protein